MTEREKAIADLSDLPIDGFPLEQKAKWRRAIDVLAEQPDILTAIKTECEKYDNYSDCKKCKFQDGGGICMIGLSPYLWDIEEIKRRLNDERID